VNHKISVRPGAGAAAQIVQYNRLRYSNILIEQPVVIVVERGTKILRQGDFECVIAPGEAVALQQGQVFDVVNAAEKDDAYLARWIAFDPELIAAFHPTKNVGAPIEKAHLLTGLQPAFVDAFGAATRVVAEPEGIPLPVARHRIGELLVWLNVLGCFFRPVNATSFAQRARQNLIGDPGTPWTGSGLGKRLGVSEATLRRKLSAEGWSFQQLLTDVRMSAAMQMLQSSDVPVLHIAQQVGYESQSRFAARFRQRFGFPPSAIRGHRR
jgi:AraC-like DNA-binding protein